MFYVIWKFHQVHNEIQLKGFEIHIFLSPLLNDQTCEYSMFPVLVAWTSCSTYNGVVGNLRLHDAHVTSL